MGADAVAATSLDSRHMHCRWLRCLAALLPSPLPAQSLPSLTPPRPATLPSLQVRTAYVTHAREGARTEVTGGLRDLKVLKTTQSGYSGFKKDRFTTLPDVEDRIVASSVTATWK